jgi:hypothetical protein
VLGTVPNVFHLSIYSDCPEVPSGRHCYYAHFAGKEADVEREAKQLARNQALENGGGAKI